MKSSFGIDNLASSIFISFKALVANEVISVIIIIWILLITNLITKFTAN